MKFYFTLTVLIQLILAFLSGNKDKMEYMLYLLKDLPRCSDKVKKNNTTSIMNFKPKKSTTEIKSEKYAVLMER
jgi:hypothetical protein